MLRGMTRPRRTSPARGLAAAVALGVSSALLSATPATASPAPAGPAPYTAAQSAAQAAPLAERRKKHKHKKKSGGKVTWDLTEYTATAGAVTAHGKIRAQGKRKVFLQVKLARGWKTFAKTHSNKKGKFTIAGTLDWYGKHKVRVSVPGRAGFQKAHKALVAPPYPVRGNPADWAQKLTSGLVAPIRQDACGTVKYLVNTDDVGLPGMAIAQLAMAEVSRATGIKVKYAGPSSLIPLHSGSRLPHAKLLIGWGTEAEIPELPAAHAVGITDYNRDGHLSARLMRDGRGKKVFVQKYTDIGLDTDIWNSGQAGQYTDGPLPNFGEILLHELGHAFGLDHSPATDEIMYYQAGNGVWPDGQFHSRYAAGDLAGLARNGRASGCNTPIRGARKVLLPAVAPVS